MQQFYDYEKGEPDLFFSLEATEVSVYSVFCPLQDTVADLVKNGYLTEKTSLTAAGSLVPNFKSSVSAFSKMV